MDVKDQIITEQGRIIVDQSETIRSLRQGLLEVQGEVRQMYRDLSAQLAAISERVSSLEDRMDAVESYMRNNKKTG